MHNPWLVFVFGVATVCFGVPILRVLPVLWRLTLALGRGDVKWPGPIARDPDPKVSSGMARLGVKPERLFPTFFQSTLGLAAAFVFSLLSLVNEFLMLVVPREGTALGLLILTAVAILGGIMSARRALHHADSVRILLSEITSGAELRQPDGRSAEAEYAIEHPLLGYRSLRPDTARALSLYCEGLALRHGRDRMKGNSLYQEAMAIDPLLHQHALEILSNTAPTCNLVDAGPVYYWLGIHSENLCDFQQAARGYEKAASVFEQLGHKKRQGRACCNLGNMHTKLGNPVLAMEEFEKATALNPSDGIAHFNIGMMYYTISSPGDEDHERALESFAKAIASDPKAYGPAVASRMRSHAYSWREDLDKVLRRAAEKHQ